MYGWGYLNILKGEIPSPPPQSALSKTNEGLDVVSGYLSIARVAIAKKTSSEISVPQEKLGSRRGEVQLLRCNIPLRLSEKWLKVQAHSERRASDVARF